MNDKEAGVSDKSLGTSVRMFTNSHLTQASTESQVESSDASGRGKTRPIAWASMRFNISMSPKHHAQTKEALAELVALRNELVHHLIERFDISEKLGCRDASAYLESCYQQIDDNYQLLRNWATTLIQTDCRSASA